MPTTHPSGTPATPVATASAATASAATAPVLPTMQAVVLRETGAPNVLRVVEAPTPVPGPGQVLVRVEAAGVNYGETMQRAGTYPVPLALPVTPGSEVAGPVAAVGPGVTGLAVGDRVAGLLVTADGVWAPGGYAAYAVVDAARAYPLPANVSPAAAVAVLGQGLTAWFLLTRAAALRPGQSVLVHAAAGGVGSLAVQLAARLGAGRVLGTASTAAKRALVERLGAEPIDYGGADWPEAVRAATDGAGVDVVLDPLGGVATAAALRCLAPFGRLVLFGALSGAMPVIEPSAWGGFVFANQSVTGFANSAYIADPMATRSAVERLLAEVAAGRLRVETTAFPLAEAARAHAALEARATTGKVVLVP